MAGAAWKCSLAAGAEVIVGTVDIPIHLEVLPWGVLGFKVWGLGFV